MGEADILVLAAKVGGPALVVFLLGMATREWQVRRELDRVKEREGQVEILRRREYDRIVAENDKLTKLHDEFFTAYRAAAVEAEKSRRDER